MRPVPEWVGKTDDAAIPPRVRLRVFLRHDGVCYLSGRKIVAGDLWDLDHKVPLCNGGTHSESNLAPVLRDKHKEKTKADVKEKATVARKAKKHYGIKKKPKKPFPGSKASGLKKMMSGEVVKRR